MYILQISDLHFAADMNVSSINEKIAILIRTLSSILKNGDQVVCCILGDIVDKGNDDLYEMALPLIEGLHTHIRSITGEDNLASVVMPGNHDICNDSLQGFNEFATKLIGKPIEYSDEHSIQVQDCFGYHFVTINSILNGERHFGQIDYAQLATCEIPEDSILMTHHSLISADPGDSAPIRNGYELQKILEEKNVIALLHGHTHGCKRYTVGQECQVIGVGPMFKQVTDISNQCNLIEIKGQHVNQIMTFTYHDDRKTWDQTITYGRTDDNNYYGSSVRRVYDRVLKDAEANLPLANLRVQIKQSFNTFEEEISSFFVHALDEARAWQGFVCPPTLEYTHGQLMNHDNIMWYDHIAETLSKNPTSKRAIIPLIDKNMAFKGGDDYLVSFDVAQFGFVDSKCTDLHITIYLRALEIRYFLPLNICEVFLMAKKLKERIQSIDRITICLFAFRSEAKPHFGCYRKAEIDLMSESKICKMISRNEVSLLRKHLYEKASMGDTVIDTAWLDRLCNAINEMYEKENTEKVKQQAEIAKKCLMQLKVARTHCSDYSLTQTEEDQFAIALRTLADLLVEGAENTHE